MLGTKRKKTTTFLKQTLGLPNAAKNTLLTLTYGVFHKNLGTVNDEHGKVSPGYENHWENINVAGILLWWGLLLDLKNDDLTPHCI